MTMPQHDTATRSAAARWEPPHPATTALLRVRLAAEAEALVERARGAEALPTQSQDESEQLMVDRERSVLAILDSRSSATLDAIAEAIARMDAGIYGQCTDCGGTIGEARLVALPYSARCLECQALDEQRPS
jgi:DnaK suppressor protein